MTYIIAQPCIDTKDASCVDVCPVDCIYEGEDMFYIHPEECIDCGACVPECPVEAIFPDFAGGEPVHQADVHGGPEPLLHSLVPRSLSYS
jgi:NAD-dependent dihydropyrimidine dehydrogenase PreA subunit